MSYRYDHRQLADEMELFFFDEQIGAGLPVWLPSGVALREALESYVNDLESEEGYVRVSSPHIAKSDLYHASGHLQSFEGNMFPPMKRDDDLSEYHLKPMNCPHHHKVFSSSLRSYRDLPLRIAEYGQVYRFENSGSLRGLSRVRGLCQNDGHIYIDPQDAEDEICRVLALHERCYRDLGLKGYSYRLSLGDPQQPEQFHGSQELWRKSEDILENCLIKMNLKYSRSIGDAAFYGPKIDIQMQMGIGDIAQEESISSIQLDFNSGEKLNLNFIDQDGKKKIPWIIHRAPLGSHERFIAMLLEYYDGQLPGWLCPIQVCLVPMNEKNFSMAQKIQKLLRYQGLRVLVDQKNGSLSKRIHFLHRLRPYAQVVLGDQELISEKIQVQLRGGEKWQGHFSELAHVLRQHLMIPGRSDLSLHESK